MYVYMCVYIYIYKHITHTGLQTEKHIREEGEEEDQRNGRHPPGPEDFAVVYYLLSLLVSLLVSLLSLLLLLLLLLVVVVEVDLVFCVRRKLRSR